MKLCRLIFLLALLPALARADEADAQLDAANQAYNAGKYEDAAKAFEDLIGTRGYSAPLCFDLGNAELKAGHLGPALLNYERARYLAPGDEAINHNLQLARKQAGLTPDGYRWWQVVLRSIDWTVWMAVMLAALAVLLAAMAGTAYAEALAARTGRKARGVRRVCKGLIFFAIPVFLFFGFVELSAAGYNARIQGVIVARQAPLRLSPFESAEQTGTLPEGELVTVEEEHDHYFWVDERSRQSGWVEGKALEPVLPGSLPGK
jgi:tetratricopeptide (TPR) repeat protein